MTKADVEPKPSLVPEEEGPVKEVVESIAIAFVLAFVFRAFVVEAFVIPTGSMAPTLLGKHMEHPGKYVCYPKEDQRFHDSPGK